jgi:integrase
MAKGAGMPGVASPRSLSYASTGERAPTPSVLREKTRKAPVSSIAFARLSARHSSRRTERTYVYWIKRYIFFHGKRHPGEMGGPEVARFLTSLAVDGRAAASTQNQASSALLFLCREVLAADLPWLDDVVRVKRPVRLPVVLTREEVRALLQRLDGAPRLMACLLYGAGLRGLECCRLRVRDIDLGSGHITVRAGKGDRTA